ncbi:MAG: hypothetical protein WB950_18290, partial [Acidobacteriaceae bacterium]
VFDLEHHEKTNEAIESAESMTGQPERTETAFVPAPDATAIARNDTASPAKSASVKEESLP